MNINPFFSIREFQAWFLARRSDEALPDTVIKNLSEDEKEGEKNGKAKRLLEIIQEFEKSPTDIEAKEKKYTELMKLFYKGIGLKEDGTGTISPSPENERAAIELSGLINDAILQDQQNISGKYSPEQLNKALKLQDKFRKNLEDTDFKKILTADKVNDTEIIAGRNDYQTEKITSYLAENKKDFTQIFQELSKAKPDLKKLTETQRGELENLKTLAGEKGQNALNKILSTFKDFKEYSFTNAALTRMKKTHDAPLLEQADTESTHSQWRKLKAKATDKPDSEEYDNKDKKTSNKTDRTLEKILARLEKLEEDRDTEKETEKQASTPWLDIFRSIGDIASNVITGLGNNNQNYCCYPPVPCSGRGSAYCPPGSYSGGGSAYCPPPRHYVGGKTWPWGSTNGCSAFNNYMPSSGSYSATSNPSATSSSNPYSSLSADNRVNISVNPVFNNNPNQSSASYSGARSSSNAAEIRRSFGINMPGIRRT
jgi:hypothetical protein